MTKERSSCENTTSSSSTSTTNTTDGDVLYTLGQHARHLQLFSEVFHGRRYWYMDFTPLFVRQTKQQHSLLVWKTKKIGLKTTSSSGAGSAGNSSSSLGVIKEYCQPFTQTELQDMFVGVDTSNVASMNVLEEPLPVRTVLIQLRPDCDHCVVFGAINESFATLHPKHHAVLKNHDNCFMAVGADGARPFVVSACIVTSKKLDTLERYCLIRFYHMDQVHIDDEEILQRIGGVPPGKTPLHSNQTPLNNMLGEACAMLQNMYHKRDIVDMLESRVVQDEEDPIMRNKHRDRLLLKKQENLTLQYMQQSVLYEIPAPKNSTRETSKFFLDNLQPSPSVLDRMRKGDHTSNMNNNNNNNNNNFVHNNPGPAVDDYYERYSTLLHQMQNTNMKPIFPSLSHKDYDVLQESWPLLERFWSELEMAKCTYNTLVEGETSRFGQRPNQPTIDKDYCIQLFQVSQQRMLHDLKQDIDHAEAALHDTLQDYTELEHQLTVMTMMRKYNIPLQGSMNDLPSSGAGPSSGAIQRGSNNPFHSKTDDSLDVGQTPISLMQRDPANFPWEFDDITLSLQDVTHTIACVCLESDFDEIIHSLQVCDRSVSHVFAALERANDADQQTFLKRRNRQAMVRLSQQQIYLKDLIHKLGRAPTIWPGLPKLQAAVQQWQEIAEQASNKDEARPQSNWVRTDSKKSSPLSMKKNDGQMAAVHAVQVPLLEWKNKYGSACITQDTIVLLSEVPFMEGSKAYDLNKVDIIVQPKGSMHKVAIMRHGKRLCGFSPTTIDPDSLVKFVRLLKSLKN